MTIINPGIACLTFDSARALSVLPRFNPGHYLATYKSETTNTVVSWSSILSTELPACQTIRGVQIRYRWATLEPTEGVYDFSAIEADLASLAAVSGGPRRLMIFFNTKIADSVSPPAQIDVAPTWMHDDPNTGTYGGGQFRYDSGGSFVDGTMLRFDNPNVRAKLNLLIQALGERFANEEYIEMITLPETSLPTPIGITVNYPAHYSGMVEAAVSFKNAFPKTIVRSLINYVEPVGSNPIVGYVENLYSGGIHALGFPNTMDDEPNFEKITPYTGSYILCRAKIGLMIIAAEVQGPDYIYTNFALTGGYDPTVQNILDFLKTQFQTQYIVWSRYTATDDDTGLKHYENVYNLLNEPAQTGDPAGGLNTVRP